MSVAILIPWRPTPDREPLLGWVTARFRDAFPDADLLLGDCNPDLPFNRSEAILDAAGRTDADVFIVSDGDVWCPDVKGAVAAVEAGAAWAVPHLMLCRLSEEATERVLAGESPEDQDDFAERPYKGFECGSLHVMSTAAFDDVGPEIRAVGWGQEEQMWSLALRCLIGPPIRGKSNCYHLFHAPQPRKNRAVGNDANLALYRRYRAARNDPVRMRALLDESKAARAGTVNW